MSLPINPLFGPHTQEHGIRSALQNGDMQRAVELLLQAYQDQVYVYCARLFGPGQALRVYQRVLAAAIDDLPRRNHTTSLRCWLFGLARRTVIHEHRVEARPEAMDPDYVPIARAGEFLAEEDADSALIQALEQLEPRIQEVLQLALWHGLGLNEIARLTEQPVAEVRELAGAGLVALSAHRDGRNGAPS